MIPESTFSLAKLNDLGTIFKYLSLNIFILQVVPLNKYSRVIKESSPRLLTFLNAAEISFSFLQTWKPIPPPPPVSFSIIYQVSLDNS